MAKENDQIQDGDILSIGITKTGFIQIEYFDALSGQCDGGDSNEYLLLTKKDCEVIAKLKELL